MGKRPLMFRGEGQLPQPQRECSLPLPATSSHLLSQRPRLKGPGLPRHLQENKSPFVSLSVSPSWRQGLLSFCL